MNDKLLIVGLYLACATTIANAAPKRAGKSCGLIKLRTARFTREFTSPGYPRKFSAQTQCTWLIEAPKLDRVKLRIQDFFLASDAKCEGQYVTFTDEATDNIYGPFCGKQKRGDEIVSTGNKLRVKLESDAISRTKRYRGFKFFFSQTKQRPTFPVGSRLRNQRTGALPIPSPTDSIVDDNDNDQINRRNQQENLRQEEDSRRMNGNIKENKDDSPLPMNNKIYPGIIRSTIVPQRRRLSSDINLNNPWTPKRHEIPSKLKEDSSEESEESSTSIYLAIFFSVLVATVIATFFIIRIRRNKQRRAKNKDSDDNQQSSPKAITISSISNGKQCPQPLTETVGTYRKNSDSKSRHSARLSTTISIDDDTDDKSKQPHPVHEGVDKRRGSSIVESKSIARGGKRSAENVTRSDAISSSVDKSLKTIDGSKNRKRSRERSKQTSSKRHTRRERAVTDQRQILDGKHSSNGKDRRLENKRRKQDTAVNVDKAKSTKRRRHSNQHSRRIRHVQQSNSCNKGTGNGHSARSRRTVAY